MHKYSEPEGLWSSGYDIASTTTAKSVDTLWWVTPLGAAKVTSSNLTDENLVRPIS